MDPQLTDLEGKVCVLTGGGIIGSCIAEGLAKNNAKVVIIDIQKDVVSRLESELNSRYAGKVIGIAASVLDKSSLLEAKKQIIDKFGQVDILINGAGGNSPSATTKDEFLNTESNSFLNDSFFGLSEDGFRSVFDLNFLGTLLPTLVFAEEMAVRREGVILNISSMNAFRPLTKIPAYSAAKAAINNFTEWLAVHFAKSNVRVNAIAPGFFLTNQNNFLLIDQPTGRLTPRAQKIIAGTPMGRFGNVEELLGTVVYLVSDMSKFVTGVVIPVDGGFNAYSGV